MEPSKLIRLEDGTVIEVAVAPDEARPIAARFAESVESRFDRVKPLLLNACRPVLAAWEEMRREVELDSAEIEFGLSFEGEGNIFITRSKATANLSVKLVVKPANTPPHSGD